MDLREQTPLDAQDSRMQRPESLYIRYTGTDSRRADRPIATLHSNLFGKTLRIRRLQFRVCNTRIGNRSCEPSPPAPGEVFPPLKRHLRPSRLLFRRGTPTEPGSCLSRDRLRSLAGPDPARRPNTRRSLPPHILPSSRSNHSSANTEGA